MSLKRIKSALISVYDKNGLEPIIKELQRLGVTIYSTGGTYSFIEAQGCPVERVEDITGYPSILGGRVKTLHPKVFGGILAMRNEDHLGQLEQYEIPTFDLVIVDLYPFEDTLKSTDDEGEIIEKIDIGGIALIRAAAKNFKDVVVVPSKASYGTVLDILKEKDGESNLADRKDLAKKAFQTSSHYDNAIQAYFDDGSESIHIEASPAQALRYGENPHQTASYYGNLSEMLEKLGGKDLSYNNLVDIDAAVQLMKEFKEAAPTFAVLKHTNACGVATRPTILDAWKAALAGDNVSAFGGILIANAEIDEATALEIDKIFYEVVIAPSFSDKAKEILTAKKKRVLLVLKHYDIHAKSVKSLLNGYIVQDTDLKSETKDDFKSVTKAAATTQQTNDLIFANACVKHLKSNTIVLIKDSQLIGMGCGQTSRVDACRQAIAKAEAFGFDVEGSVMASDAFFPFPDCVEIAHNAGVKAVVQPGGSIKDQLSIDFCDAHNMPMLFTGIRHFKH